MHFGAVGKGVAASPARPPRTGFLATRLPPTPPTHTPPSLSHVRQFTYNVVGFLATKRVTYKEALAAAFVEGWIFIAISLTGVRARLVELIPKNIMYATAAGACGGLCCAAVCGVRGHGGVRGQAHGALAPTHPAGVGPVIRANPAQRIVNNLRPSARAPFLTLAHTPRTPPSTPSPTAPGIGVFLAFIGLQQSEGIAFVTFDPATLVTIGGCPPEDRGFMYTVKPEDLTYDVSGVTWPMMLYDLAHGIHAVTWQGAGVPGQGQGLRAQARGPHVRREWCDHRGSWVTLVSVVWPKSVTRVTGT